MPNRIIKRAEDLGFDAFFESSRERLGLGGFSVARVIAEHKAAYMVKNPSGEYLAKVTGKQMYRSLSREDYPAVGDWVAISELGDNRAVIRGVLARKTVIKRKRGRRNETQIIAANIDVAFVIESVDRDFNLNRFERYFALAADGGVRPAAIINKTDLISQEELERKLAQVRARLPGADVISTSARSLSGLGELKNFIEKGKTYSFLGSSGVGKSSLINMLAGSAEVKTGSIGAAASRGRHITTAREMYFLENGGILIDNPGMREVGMTDAKEGISSVFDEIGGLAGFCRYADCTHVHEPGCEVQKAVKSGQLDKEKYENYINLKKEAEHYEMDEYEKRSKARQFGKFLKKAKKELGDYGHKSY